MSESSLKSDKPKTALVTGATGFVGSHVVRLLTQEGWRVHILSRKNSRLSGIPDLSCVTNHIHDGSTQNMVECVAQAKPDIVFHLASLFLAQHAAKDIEPLIQSNLLFGNQLLEAMRVNGVSRIINTGTSWQHFHNEDYNPVCLYAATKQAFEALLEYYIEACGIQAITLKLFDTYGPNDPRPKLFHLLNKTVKNGEPLDMSAGEQLIDLVHVDDVVEAYLIAAERLSDGNVTRHEDYAVSSGRPLPLRKLVEFYASLAKRNVPINWGMRPYRFREVMVPWTNGQPLPGWSPKRSLSDGIRQILNDLDNHFDQAVDAP